MKAQDTDSLLVVGRSGAQCLLRWKGQIIKRVQVGKLRPGKNNQGEHKPQRQQVTEEKCSSEKAAHGCWGAAQKKALTMTPFLFNSSQEHLEGSDPFWDWLANVLSLCPLFLIEYSPSSWVLRSIPPILPFKNSPEYALFL